jgi:hypothetical protein
VGAGEDATHAGGERTVDARAVDDFVGVLRRSYVAARLRTGLEWLVAELAERARSLAADAPFELTVARSGLWHGARRVARAEDGLDLSRTLWSCGVRVVRFHAGVDEHQLRRLLCALGATATRDESGERRTRAVFRAQAPTLELSTETSERTAGHRLPHVTPPPVPADGLSEFAALRPRALSRRLRVALDLAARAELGPQATRAVLDDLTRRESTAGYRGIALGVLRELLVHALGEGDWQGAAFILDEVERSEAFDDDQRALVREAARLCCTTPSFHAALQRADVTELPSVASLVLRIGAPAVDAILAQPDCLRHHDVRTALVGLAQVDPSPFERHVRRGELSSVAAAELLLSAGVRIADEDLGALAQHADPAVRQEYGRRCRARPSHRPGGDCSP